MVMLSSIAVIPVVLIFKVTACSDDTSKHFGEVESSDMMGTVYKSRAGDSLF